MRSLTKATASLALALSLALTGCGSSDSEEGDSEPAPTSKESTPEVTEPAEETDPSEAPEEPEAEGGATDTTQVCAEVSEEVGDLSLEALENVTDTAASTKIYNQIADAYEAGMDQLDDQEAEDAFQAQVDLNRDIADDGVTGIANNRLSKVTDQFVKACFGG